MRANERNWIYVVAGLALIVAFWFLVLGPKRDEASELSSKVSVIELAVSEQEQRADFAEQARKDFPSNYQRVVVLGKAAPESSDTASFIVQVNRIASDAGVDFKSMALGDAAAAPVAPTTQPGLEAAPPASSQPSAQEPAPEPGQPAATTTAPAATPATEASASTLAIGAGVGPAGLSVLRYDLSFDGDFFHVADFIHGLNELITSREGRLVVDGRLTTIDGFSLAADEQEGFPKLTASFSVTTYLTPPDQGMTAGATPSGPGAGTPGEAPVQTASTGATP